ncbi:hypothetical protein H0H81_008447 [Sphagnurus paluster]|uniref:Cytochrome P450 n=1 Tax=Sphagnurus paluster TaxID=117069 RepID=A0A9P7G1B3_9AGAR|nr:hypothetical protein H0H81_008447 [Sphagnurus paluster]
MILETQPLLQVVALGVLTHLYFRKFEPTSLTNLVSIIVPAPLALLAIQKVAPLNAGQILLTYSVFLVSLICSIVLYRVSPFHPLAKYPGPLINKITQFRNVWVQHTGHLHLVNKDLHDKYGPFVRIGPNELSVIDINAALAILGPGGLGKGRYYEARKDPRAPGNLLALQGQAHTDRRRLWSRAFTNESLANHEDALVKRVESLLTNLTNVSSSPSVDLSMWLSLFSLDFMGDMASISILSQVPWVVQTAQRLPFLSENILKLRQFAVEHGTARFKKGADKKDLWYHLVGAFKDHQPRTHSFSQSDEAGLEKERPAVGAVIADSALAMIAGSDTTATGLSNLFYFLMSHPHCLKRLQAEIDDVFPKDESPLSSSKHSKLPYLTACINECLRLLPPAPTNGPRQVPQDSSGRLFAGRFIPAGTQVYTPIYSIHRNPEYFSPQTDEFVPERWLASGRDDADQTLNLNAFIPFSYGQANCVGRNLARREMMMVASAVIHKFDIRFADGFKPEAWVDQLHDHFVTTRGALPVILSLRV